MPQDASGTAEIRVNQIDLNRFNVRLLGANSADFKDLVESVRKCGVVQPILVRPLVGGRYEVVCGQRRLDAARASELDTIPAVVREVSDAEMLLYGLVENLQRKDLAAEDVENAVHELSASYPNQTELARAIGKSQPWVSQLLTAYDARHTQVGIAPKASTTKVLKAVRERKRSERPPAPRESTPPAAPSPPTPATVPPTAVATATTPPPKYEVVETVVCPTCNGKGRVAKDGKALT